MVYSVYELDRNKKISLNQLTSILRTIQQDVRTTESLTQSITALFDLIGFESEVRIMNHSDQFGLFRNLERQKKSLFI